MSDVIIDVSSNKTSRINLGIQGENIVEHVIFNIASWIEEYGEGVAYVYARRSGDLEPYPVALDMDMTEKTATWDVNLVDTAVKGRGSAQLVYVVDEDNEPDFSEDEVKKTKVFATTVQASLVVSSEENPEGYSTWLEVLGGYTVRVESAKAAAQAAQTAAETAQGLAEDAQEAAESARDAAQSSQAGASASATNAAASASAAATSETNAANSATSASTSASAASASATNASNSASAAAASAATAGTAATNASQSATAAAGSATSAGQSASAASSSASSAAQSATSASSSASAASTSETNAAASATSASGSASSAAQSATNASGSASTATAAANTATTKASEASASATSAAESASDASDSADAAAASAEAAAQSAASLTVDTELDDTSTNPVQNKAITAEITDLKEDMSHINVGNMALNVTKGEHYSSTGAITTNPSMGRTDYLDCSELKKLYVKSTVSATYNCFFEEDKTFISRFTLAVGDNVITVPDNAVYFGISCTVNDIEKMEVKNAQNVILNQTVQNVGLLEDGFIGFETVNGEIIYPNGTFTPVVGWSRSDYIDCSRYEKMVVIGPSASNYNGFFDSNKGFITGSSFTINIGENIIEIPANANYVMFSNTTATINQTEIYSANSSDIKIIKDELVGISESMDCDNNFPIIPSQLFFRNDISIPVFKRSLFQKPANATNADVGIIYENSNGYKRVIDIKEPTNIGGVDGEKINGGTGRFYLSNTKGNESLFYKDIDIFLKDVSGLNGKTVSVMSVGDSLTQGASWDGTPVTALSDELAKVGVTTTFIGSLGKKILKVGIGKQLVMFEGRGGWRYRTLTGREAKFAGINVVIPSSQTKTSWIEDVDGTYDEIKVNNTFLYPATATDKVNYPNFCYHFVTGNTGNNVSYAEDSTLSDYVIFDPTRYFSERQIDIPDIVTIAFGTNEWYVSGYDLQEALSDCQFIIEAFRRASNTMKIVVIPHNSLNMRKQTEWETKASQLTAGVIKVVDTLIANGDTNLYCCPLYANGSRYLSYKAITETEDFGTNNDVEVGTISEDVHCLYETGFAASYMAMPQYIDGLTACVANIIE